MKRTFFPAAFLLFSCYPVLAQKTPAPAVREQTQNISIHKKGGDKEKTTIVIDGDKITVNGKPLKDYKGGILITENEDNDFNLAAPLPPLPPIPAHGGAKSFIRDFSINQNSAFLGVYSESDDNGAKVNSVTKDSPAEKAGLKTGDVITKVGDNNISDADDLIDAVGKYKPADKVSVTYLRDKKESIVTVTLDKNKQPGYAFSFGDNKDFMNSFNDFSSEWNNGKPRMGMRIQDVETGSGVKVTDVDDGESPAAKAGLQEDDIITQVNGKNVSSVKDAKNALADIKPGDDITVSYQRKGAAQTATVHIPKPLHSSDL